MRAPALLPPALLTCCGWLLAPVTSVHPECRFHLEIQEEETKCAELLRTQTEKYKEHHNVDPPRFRDSQPPVAPTLDSRASDGY